MGKTIAEINEKIRAGNAIVVTAEEIIDIVKTRGAKQAARDIDVVTTGTFSPMCSSGALLNFKQPKEKMKIGGGRATLNNVPIYAGLAAADVYLGATALPDTDPRNSNGKPGKFKYGGAHVIEDLVSGRDVLLKAEGYGTDCYPNTEREEYVKLSDLNNAVLLNPRNCYQNYNVAVNLSDKSIYTYMGKLKPKLGNANYCSAGQLSPLFNDPCYRTIGIGTRVFICGAHGFVVWSGTQHAPDTPRLDNGIPKKPAGTLTLMGDLKQMDSKWVRAVSFAGYGVTLSIAVGIPIPILDEEMVRFTAVSDEEITAPVVDYSRFYPYGEGEPLVGEVSYAELRSGSIDINGKSIPTGSFSSYAKAREVAEILKSEIAKGDFLLTEPQAPLWRYTPEEEVNP